MYLRRPDGRVHKGSNKQIRTGSNVQIVSQKFCILKYNNKQLKCLNIWINFPIITQNIAKMQYNKHVSLATTELYI